MVPIGYDILVKGGCIPVGGIPVRGLYKDYRFLIFGLSY